MRSQDAAKNSTTGVPDFKHHSLSPRLRTAPDVKRLLDILLAIIMLPICLPVAAVAAAAIWAHDGHSFLYSQRRWGQGGKVIRVLKFRTMIPNSDRDYGVRPAAENDERVTRVGRWLRATGVDELPQLINILKGEMSFVGPRALAVAEDVRVEDTRILSYEDLPGFCERLTVRPGLTSPSTLVAPKDVSPIHKFDSDLRYIQQRSLGVDLFIIGLSICCSFLGRWESRATRIGKHWLTRPLERFFDDLGPVKSKSPSSAAVPHQIAGLGTAQSSLRQGAMGKNSHELSAVSEQGPQ